MRRFLICFHIIFLLIFKPVHGYDTIFIKDKIEEVEILDKIYVLIDKSNKYEIDDLINKESGLKFKKNEKPTLNFGLTADNIWLKFIIKNISTKPLNYIINISNPDLNLVAFHEFYDSELTKIIETGESTKIDTREIYNKNYVFNLNLNPGKSYTYYIKSFNEGDANFIPISLNHKEYFEKINSQDEFFVGLINGLFIFFILFHLYLFFVSKDIINLYSTLYMLFMGLCIFAIDGYFCQLTSHWLSKYCSAIKILTPLAAIYFILSFSQIFLETPTKRKRLNKIFIICKVLSMIFAFFYFLGYPYLIVTVIGLSVIFTMVHILIIIASITYYNKDYMPSKYFLSAFFIMFLCAIIYQLRDYGVFSSNFLVYNSLRFGLVFEGSLLTLTVLERFRINQENANMTIQESYEKIQYQKNQLLKINAELEKLSIIASETDNSVAIYDSNGNIEWCNSGFERIYDVTLDELTQSGKYNIKDILNYKNIKKLVDFSIENTQPVFFENKVKTRKKREIWLQTTITPYIAEQGKVNKLIAIDSDISELKLYERNLTIAKEKAEESGRLKTAFLTNTSHEIRTPLNGILGFSFLLKKDNLPDSKRKRYIEIIEKNGQQLLKLIDDILDISLIESNQLKINITEFNLNNILNEVFDEFELFKKNNEKDHIEIKIKKSLADNNDKLHSDPVRLKQVLNNLVDNALKYTDKGYIYFGYTIKASYLKFFVEDSGPGISDDKKKTLFERFAQGEEILKRKHKGPGLGLSISRGIIDRLNGEIWLDESYKKGARLYFTIPLNR